MSSEALEGTFEALRPPPRLSLSEWAERHYYLSAESAAEPGRWRTLPYQRGVLDAIGDPLVERVTWIKSARVGATKCINVTIGYHIDHDPCPILVVQPTVEDAQGYSKEEIATMLRDCPQLAGRVSDAAKVSDSTILHKTFPGGSLSMVGANSGRGFRRVSRRIVIFDEVDGYPPSAGAEGDQIRLGIKRAEYYWNRKIIAVSTPTVAGASRIERMFETGDRRRYFVPCPHCGFYDVLTFREGDSGHWMAWPKDAPARAHFVCRDCGCEIGHEHKRGMLEAGEWRAAGEFRGHASFHIWAAYSLSPNATWGAIAEEFVEAKAEGPEALRTWVNTVAGETWHDRGEAPDWERLYGRRESYQIGTVPAGVEFLTAGVDVQQDRLVYEVVGWGADRQSWSVEAGELYGPPADAATWAQLDTLLGRTFEAGDAAPMPIALLAVDSGAFTQEVYSWARRYPMSRVIACKGQGSARALIGLPSPVDVTVRGRRKQRGYKVWPVGVDIAKGELYGWLRLPLPLDGEAFPPGWCHFPEHGAEYFKQLTAEQLVTRTKRSGFTVREWQVLPGRQNHFLDCRVYARAAAAVLGLDRAAGARARRVSTTEPARSRVAGAASSPEGEAPGWVKPRARARARARPRRRGSWLGGGRRG